MRTALERQQEREARRLLEQEEQARLEEELRREAAGGAPLEAEPTLVGKAIDKVRDVVPTNVLTKGVLGLTDIAGRAIAARRATKPTSEDEANQKRLAQLRRMDELNALGLTDQEKDAFFAKADAQLYGQGLEAAQRRGQALATSGVRGGAALLDAALVDATQAGARQQVEAAALAADVNAAARQRQEMERLSATENERLRGAQAVKGENILRTTGSLIDAVTSTLDEQGTLNRDEFDAFMKRTGMDRKTARAYLRAKNAEYQRTRRSTLNDEDVMALVNEGTTGKGGK